MTDTNDKIIDQNPENQPEETNQEIPKIIPHIPKVSKFGSQPSKFGKGPVQNFQNPIQKGRPGRAAARGR